MSDTFEAQPSRAEPNRPAEPAVEAAGGGEAVVVTFATQWGSYNAGESAAFGKMDADALIAQGVATAGGEGGTDADRIEADRPDLPPGGVMVAGLEHPPRIWPPDPQHLDIPRTFDPRVSVQLDRAARDIASGQDGAAAQEDLDRQIADLDRRLAAREKAVPKPVAEDHPQPAQPLPAEPQPQLEA